MPKKIPGRGDHGTVPVSIRLGRRSKVRIEAMAEEWGATPSQLMRFILVNITEADVKRMVFASISRIDDEDRDDVSEEGEHGE